MGHQPKDVTVRLQALDGAWEVGGADRKRGIHPENVSLTADRAGSAKATFDLRRDALAVWPDLGPFTPVDIEIGGLVVWSGRVVDAHGGRQVISVECEGWQYHLDDDLLEHVYVHQRLSDYQDARSYPTALLGNLGGGLAADGQVSADKIITLGWPVGRQMVQYAKVGVELDLGPTAGLAERVVVEWEHSGEGNVRFLARGTSVEHGAAVAIPDYDDCISFACTPAGSGSTTSATISPGRRYITLMLQADVTFTPAADVWFKIKAARVFTDTAYESGGVSVLQAPTAINDILDRGTMLLSADRSQIDPDGTITFDIPELELNTPSTPREGITAINAYHDYVTQIDVERRMVFKPKPSAPALEVGGWSAMDFEGSGASGEDIYNRAIVATQTPDGYPLRVDRYRADTDTAGDVISASPAPTNPSFATNTTGWSVTGGTITRDTGNYDTSPASGRWDFTSGPDVLTGTMTGTFLRGVAYRLTLVGRGGFFVSADIAFGVADDETVLYRPFAGAWMFGPAGWSEYSLVWVPRADTSSARVQLRSPEESGGTTGSLNIDSLQVAIAQATVVDRRNFRRSMSLPGQAALPSDGVAAQRIADLWLADHRTTPFKDSGRLTGDAVRDILTGATVPLEQLLLRTQQLLRFSDRIDPDTGAQGRDGRIVAVKYTPADDEAEVTIDNTRASFEAMVARLAVVTGAGGR